MKKIITILLAFAMFFVFVACDPVTGGKDPINNSETGNNLPSTDTNQPSTDEIKDPTEDNNSEEINDPFANIEETLTIPVTSLEDFDFTGTWDFIEISPAKDSFGSYCKTEKGYITITDGKVTFTLTYFDTFFNFVSEEAYKEQKTSLQEFPENSFEPLKFDDKNMTITAVASPEFLKSMNYESTLEEFINILYDNDSYDGITTNESKTAFKADFGDEDYSSTLIYIKR